MISATFERLQALGIQLYDQTQEDWIISVENILTEPTCPQCTIAPEARRSTAKEFVALGDTIEEAILNCADRAEAWLKENAK